jgi:hypothetical protein
VPGTDVYPSLGLQSANSLAVSNLPASCPHIAWKNRSPCGESTAAIRRSAE